MPVNECVIWKIIYIRFYTKKNHDEYFSVIFSSFPPWSLLFVSLWIVGLLIQQIPERSLIGSFLLIADVLASCYLGPKLKNLSRVSNFRHGLFHLKLYLSCRSIRTGFWCFSDEVKFFNFGLWLVKYTLNKPANRRLNVV